MGNLQTIGTGLTLILLVTSLFITAIAAQEPNSFGMNEAVENLTLQDEEIEFIISSFNSDFNIFSNSEGLNQIPLGATSIISGSKDIINFFALGVFGWTIVIDLMFAWNSNPDITLFVIMLKTFFNMIMIFTIVGYLGGMIRSLPFFGGG